MKSIFLKRGKDESLRRFHPWIFSGAIQRMSEEPEEGEKVMVFSNENEYISTAHFQTYKKGTLHMVKSLNLLDVKPLDPEAMTAIFTK